MTATTNGKSWFNLGADSPDPGSEASMKFWETHKAWFTEGVNMVVQFAAAGDTASLILADAGLLGLCQNIRDRLAAAGVTMPALPPRIGDELSKKVQ